MSRRAFSPRDAKRRRAVVSEVAPIAVSDHALVRYLDRVLDIDIERLRAEIGVACARHQGAPCVRVGGARFIIRNQTVVTTYAGNQMPFFRELDALRARPDEEEPV